MKRLTILILAGLMLMAVGAGAQNPGGITTAPIQWNKADAISGATDAAALPSWVGSAGQTMAQATSARQPIYHVGTTAGSLGPNNKPYVNFSGSQGLITTALNQSAVNYTFFAVVRLPDTINGHWLFDSQTGRFVVYPLTSSGGGVGWYDGAFRSAAPASSFTAGAWSICAWVFNGTTGTVYVNGTQVGTTAYTPQAIGGTTAIGNAYDTATGGGGGASPVGDAAEFILEPAALSSADQSAIGNYLASKYAISTTYTGGAKSVSASPSTLTTGTSGNTVTLTGTGTTWTTGTTFSVTSTGTGAAITATSVNAGTQVATLTVTSGTAGTLTYTNSSDAATASQSVATTTLTIAPNNAGILYSPYTWLVTVGAAKTINSGAYFRTLVSGTTSCVVGLTVGAATPYSQVYARLTGGAWQKYTPSAAGAQTWTLALPSGSTAAKYLLEVLVKSTTETADRWNAQTTAVQFTGLTLDAGGTVSLPASRKYRVLIYGDSITEGVRVNGFSGITNDTDRNDNTLDYSYKLGELLDAEIGVVAFGATGVQQGGSGNVPALTTSYSLLWSGQARSFAAVPDLVIYNECTNETGISLSLLNTAFGTVINGIGYTGTANTYSGLNGTRHLILRPFGGYQAANLQTIASGFSSTNVVYGDTTGLWVTADSSDNLHPYGYAHLGTIAPGVAALAMPLLHPASITAASAISLTRQLPRGR